MPEETTTNATTEQTTVGTPEPVVTEPKLDVDDMSKFEFAEDKPSMPDKSTKADVDEPEVQDEPDVETESDVGLKTPAEVSPGKLAETDVARARQFGFTDSDVARFKSTDELDMHIGLIMRADQQRQQAALASQRAPQDQQGPQQAPAQPVSNVPQAKFPLQLDSNVADEISGPLQQMNEFYASQVAQLQQAVGLLAREITGPVQMHIQDQQQQKTLIRAERFDNFINGLGEDWVDVFGTGATLDMDVTTKEAQNRLRLIQASEDIARGRATAKEFLTDGQRWKRGLGLEFGDLATQRAANKEKKKIAAQLSKQGNRIVSRPSGTRRSVGAPPLGRGRAISQEGELAAKAAELGITFDDEIEE